MSDPMLGSLISAFVGIFISFFFGITGMAIFDQRVSIWGTFCLLVAVCLAFSSTIGILIGCTPWDILRSVIT